MTPPPDSGQRLYINRGTDRLVIADDDGNPLVSVHSDGSLTYGEGYDPDEAARIFWNALARHSPIPPPDSGQERRPYFDGEGGGWRDGPDSAPSIPPDSGQERCPDCHSMLRSHLDPPCSVVGRDPHTWHLPPDSGQRDFNDDPPPNTYESVHPPDSGEERPFFYMPGQWGDDSPQPPDSGQERWRCGECGTKLTPAQQRCHDPAFLQTRVDDLQARIAELEAEVAHLRSFMRSVDRDAADQSPPDSGQERAEEALAEMHAARDELRHAQARLEREHPLTLVFDHPSVQMAVQGLLSGEEMTVEVGGERFTGRIRTLRRLGDSGLYATLLGRRSTLIRVEDATSMEWSR